MRSSPALASACGAAYLQASGHATGRKLSFTKARPACIQLGYPDRRCSRGSRIARSRVKMVHNRKSGRSGAKTHDTAMFSAKALTPIGQLSLPHDKHGSAFGPLPAEVRTRRIVSERGHTSTLPNVTITAWLALHVVSRIPRRLLTSVPTAVPFDDSST